MEGGAGSPAVHGRASGHNAANTMKAHEILVAMRTLVRLSGIYHDYSDDGPWVVQTCNRSLTAFLEMQFERARLYATEKSLSRQFRIRHDLVEAPDFSPVTTPSAILLGFSPGLAGGGQTKINVTSRSRWFVSGHDFSRADKSFIFVIPRGL